jgi:DNA-binding NtrC family response regulator
VDDDERVLFVMRNALQRVDDGYRVVTVHNGREALDKAKTNSFDLLITDLRMSDMDGVTLTEKILELHHDVVVLWITAFGSHRVRDDVERLGVYRCVDKPLEVDEIRQIVSEALTSGQGSE